MRSSSTKQTLSVITGGSPEDVTDDLVGSVQRYVDAVVAPLREQILVQQVEIEALKARPSPQIDGFIDRTGMLMLTKPDGSVREVGVVVGRDGATGKDGEPGLGFDDLTVERVNERCIVLKFVRGERVKDFPVDLPAVIYRGVYTEGIAYEHGDLVTWAGGLWHANQPTVTKPGAGNKAWTLCTKAGRDGRDGRSAYDVAVDKGFKGSETEWLKSLKGPPGPPGKDLRHLSR
jgi:hypothetical protein